MSKILAALYQPIDEFFKQSTRLSYSQWLMVLGFVGFFGFFCMRGISSKKNF